MDCLLERSYHAQTHTPAVVDAHKFIERPWLESVRSASKLNLKLYSNELWNELHNYAQMYRNVLQCTEMYSNVQQCTPMYWNVLQTARAHWRLPVLFFTFYCFVFYIFVYCHHAKLWLWNIRGIQINKTKQRKKENWGIDHLCIS